MTTTAPMASSPSWRSLMPPPPQSASDIQHRAVGGLQRSPCSRPRRAGPLLGSSRCYLLSKFKRLLDIHGDDPGDALLLHSDADQLPRHLHCELVVADEQELCLLGHLAHQVAEALDVGVVQGPVNLVEQAERRRVELEHREHQRNCRKRLFSAREQMNGGVLLAGRPRHHLNPGVEYLLSGHDQARLAAAEQDRKQVTEMLVYAVEGRLEQRARLAIDLADRAVQSLQCLREVGCLRVQKLLAL